MRGKSFLTAALWLLTCSVAQATVIDFDDARRSEQWYLDAMNFPAAWGLVYDLPKRAVIRTAVLDSGFDLDHVELSGHTLAGYNVVTGQKRVYDANPHGTATLGLMAAQSGNATGIARAAFTANVLPVQITIRSDGAAFVHHMAQGIRYAANQGARVINLSYEGVNLGVLAEAAKYANKRGAVVFMAAGNDGQTQAGWQNHGSLVAVGSVNSSWNLSSFSNRGSFVDLVAPGQSILTTKPGDEYGYWSGTSLASPLAASVAALVLTANPKLTAWQVMRILNETAIDLGPAGKDDAFGHGMIDAEAAVARAIAMKGKFKPQKAAKIQWSKVDLSSLGGLELSAGLIGFEPGAGLVTVVPEPGSLVLLVAGATACLYRRR